MSDLAGTRIASGVPDGTVFIEVPWWHGLPGKGTHCVYRLYGPCGTLRYIGCTSNARQRIRTHARQWGHMLDRFEVDSFPTSREAFKAEQHLIALLRPPVNNPNAPAMKKGM